MQSRSPANIDEDAIRAGDALRRLRKRLDLTQAQAAAAHEAEMTPQYWGMHETGRVPGIHKPAVQRALVEALSRASGQQVTVEDLAAELRPGGASFETPRIGRLAAALSDRGGDDVREAVFPTIDGDVVVRFPGHMTPDGFKDLEAYLAVFLRTQTRDQ